EFDYDGTDTVTATTCPGTTPTSPQFIGQVDLTGAPSRFSGRNTFAAPPSTGVDGGTITGENIYNFDGSINGDTATGTFHYEQKSQSTGGGGGPVQQGAVGTFTITFTKS